MVSQPPVREEEQEPVRGYVAFATRRKEEAMNPEHHRPVTGTGLWLQGPHVHGVLRRRGQVVCRDRRDCGRDDMEAVAVTCVVARGLVDAWEALSLSLPGPSRPAVSVAVNAVCVPAEEP